MNDEHEAALTRLLDALDASENVRDFALAVVHRAVEAGFHEKRSIEGVVASAVFIAFRRAGNAHSLEEIASVSAVNRTTLARLNKRLARELGITLEPADPHEFVSRFVASLNISDSTESAAHTIIDKAVADGLHSGVSPAGVAAGAVYLADWAYFSHSTQEEIADVAGLSPVTIRQRYTDQLELLGLNRGDSSATARSQLSALQ